jgi:uncharacterized protein YecE (DUF72 family)
MPLAVAQQSHIQSPDRCIERSCQMAMIVRIGTAGWSIPAPYRSGFAVTGSILERYARELTCVEINSSFYRPHQRSTYEKWARATPRAFRFSVKAPRQATHFQRLKDPEPVLDRFTHEIEGLGPKLGVVLVQLPPSLHFERPTAARFFASLRERTHATIACEPRHASWFTSDVDQWMRERRIARAAADPSPVSQG